MIQMGTFRDQAASASTSAEGSSLCEISARKRSGGLGADSSESSASAHGFEGFHVEPFFQKLGAKQSARLPVFPRDENSTHIILEQSC